MQLGRLAAPNQTKEYQHKRAEMQLDTYILPHIGTDAAVRKEKGYYLLRMLERASLVAFKKVKSDDKDHYANKRVKLAGDLMEELFNNAMKFFIRDIKYHVERTTARGRRLTVRTNINPDTLTEKLLYAMGTGSWPAGQTGVSQVLDRVNFMSSMAHLRRVKSPLSKKHPHFKARDVHGTHIGKICPSETPEGADVGLTKYLAIMARVTVGAELSALEGKLKEMKELEVEK
jgi:DNA-directed RNA polymerase subunit B"